MMETDIWGQLALEAGIGSVYVTDAPNVKRTYSSNTVFSKHVLNFAEIRKNLAFSSVDFIVVVAAAPSDMYRYHTIFMSFLAFWRRYEVFPRYISL